MRGKLLFITGGFVGYVLGARAGRKRYDQIAAAANDLWNAQPVQRRVTEVRDAALDLVGDVPGTLYKAGKKAVTTAAAKKKKATPAKPAKAAKPAKPVHLDATPTAKPKPASKAAPKPSSKASDAAQPATDDSAAH